jgi:hypothetical protein
MKLLRVSLPSIACLAIFGWLAPAALAIQLTVDSAAANVGNSANYLNSTSGRHGEFRSQVTTLDPGGTDADVVSNAVDGRVRYASVTSADTGSFYLGQVIVAASDYSVTFTVSAPLNVYYDIAVDTSRMGAFTLVSDSGSNGGATADLSALAGSVSGSLNNNPEPALGLADLAPSSVPGNSGSSVNTPFSQSNQLLLTNLTGTNTYTLRFVWSSAVTTNPGSNTSSTNTDNGAYIFGGDETAVRMGLAGSGSSISGGISADDYPGVGSRTQADDGHFVSMKATIVAIVPEPSSLVLAAMAMVGIVVTTWRRRKA